jgi:hypothetical protein
VQLFDLNTGPYLATVTILVADAVPPTVVAIPPCSCRRAVFCSGPAELRKHSTGVSNAATAVRVEGGTSTDPMEER